MAKLTFWSGVGEVTGSNFMIEFPGAGSTGARGARILVDCGLLQGGPGAYEFNKQKFPYEPSSAQALFITHAHMDHIGRVPKLVRDGFRGPIFSTPQTKEIAAIMYDDALKIMNAEAHRRNDHQPMYAQADVDRALSQWVGHPYHEKFSPVPAVPGAASAASAAGAPNISVQLLDAGHILGSAMIEFTNTQTGRKIIFTGDSGNSPAAIVRDTEPLTGANYVVIDSTYGDRTHVPWEEGRKKLRELVRKTIEQKGVLLVPAFSLERTHIILYELNNIFESGDLPTIPVYLDTPLANRLTPIYERSIELFNDGAKRHIASGDDIFKFPKLQTVRNTLESAAISHSANPKIIIAGSGMSVGGRIPQHEIDYLPDPKTIYVSTGYQGIGTLGRQLEEGAREVQISGQRVPVRARIEAINSFSAHRDMPGLLALAETAAKTVEEIFVVMGEPKASLFLTQRIRDYLDLNATAADRGKGYEINL